MSSRLQRRLGQLRRSSAESGRLAETRIALLEGQILGGRSTRLGDGRYFGYFSAAAVDEHPRVLVDLARFLTGLKAEQAAAQRGDEMTNAYYVVNDEPNLSMLVVSPDANVLIVGPKTDFQSALSVNLSSWLTAVKTGLNLNDYSSIHNGYWITIDGGQVVRLEEQWVP